MDVGVGVAVDVAVGVAVDLGVGVAVDLGVGAAEDVGGASGRAHAMNRTKPQQRKAQRRPGPASDKYIARSTIVE